MFSVKIKEEDVVLGCFVSTPCCTECDWFSQPLLVVNNGFLPMPRIVCPDCGATVSMKVGRYQIKTQKRLFSTKTSYIGFIVKDV